MKKGNVTSDCTITRLSSSAIIDNTDVLFDRKLDLITEGLEPYLYKKIQQLSKNNAVIIINYIMSLKTETVFK
jgi:hypothetical protein